MEASVSMTKPVKTVVSFTGIRFYFQLFLFSP